MKTTIPKKIIQIGCRGPNASSQTFELSPLIKACTKSVQVLNPEFEYTFFNDEKVKEFIDKEELRYRNAFYNFKYSIQRFDFFRYLAIYRYGGFYFDLDVLLSESITPLLREECVFPFEKITIFNHFREIYNFDWDLGNYAFGAAPGHPFIKAIIEDCIEATKIDFDKNELLLSAPRFLRNDAKVLTTTGPGLVTKTFAKNSKLRKSIKILINGSRYDFDRWYKFGSYGVHLMSSSWRKGKNPLHRILYNRLNALHRSNIIKSGKNHKGYLAPEEFTGNQPTKE